MRLLGCLILTLSLGCGGGGQGNPPSYLCTLVGCSPSLTLRSGTLAVTEQQIQGSTIRVCRNQVCFDSTFAGWQPPPEGGGSGIGDFPDVSQRDTLHTPLINAVVWRQADGFRVDVSYRAWLTTDVRDGDVYDVTITMNDGNKLIDSHQSVSYVISHPNGEHCGPECHTAAGAL
jgi:hypothetical protein